MAAPPDVDFPSLVSGLGQYGPRTALSFYRGKALEGRLSYLELQQRVEALAGGLSAALGVRPGDRVALLTPNRLEVPVLVLAVLRLGAAVVPLNPAASPEDWAYILGHSGARGLCGTAELLARAPTATAGRFSFAVEEAFGLRGEAPAPEGGLQEALGAILYTSGTTGNPKGVALRQRNLVANAWSMARNFRLSGTVQYAVLPLYHAHAFGFGLMTALTTGGHLVFSERLEPFTWARVVRAESVEVSSVVPSLLPPLRAAGVTKAQVPSLRCLMVSSAPLSAAVARDFEASSQLPLIQGWGLSEYTNFACCVSPFESAVEHERLMYGFEVPSIGPALEGTEVRVVDAAGRPAEEGARGELSVRGHSLMQGYYRDEENTARALDAEGWLHTGDEGLYRLHAGRPVYFVTGRLKEIIIRDAEKYSPLRLEGRLLEAVPELSGRLVVLGFPHREHGEEVGAYVETEAWDGALKDRLAAALEALPLAERPKVVLHGTRPIPRTHTGKIQRRKMQPWFARWAEHRGPTVVEEVPAGTG